MIRNNGGRVLAFGAHPDDMEIDAGGMIARLAKEGAKATMAVVCCPSNSAVRIDEAKRGAATLGAEFLLVNDTRECRVEDIPMYELVWRFDTLIDDLKPDLVITPGKTDLHFDHGLVHTATISALRRQPCDLLAYLSSPEMNAQSRCFGQCFVNVTETIDTKLAAIACHESQLAKLDLESSKDLARAMGRMSGFQYAEAYEVLRARI
jgi:LmbE family N-acetylglucosaminyl deacetylase